MTCPSLGRMSIAALVAAFVWFAAGAQPRGTRTPPAAAWTARLEALEPSRPLDYFELAEEMVDAAQSDSDRRLARELFALAGVLEPYQLGRSACLALADMESDVQERRRLIALASLLNRQPNDTALSERGSSGPGASEAVLAVCDAFSAYRLGKGREARKALATPGAMDLLASGAHVFAGGVDQFLADCDRYTGGERPTLYTELQATRDLRLELALLDGEARSWSGDLLLNRGRRLIEVDPARLDVTLGVDAHLAYFRNGRWVPGPDR